MIIDSIFAIIILLVSFFIALLFFGFCLWVLGFIITKISQMVSPWIVKNISPLIAKEISPRINKFFYETTAAHQLVKMAEILKAAVFIEIFSLIIYFGLSSDKIPVIMSFFNLTYFFNFKNFIFSPNEISNFPNISSGFSVTSQATNNLNFSFGNLSGLISVISIIIIYLYFYKTLGNTKYFAKGSETQEKYGEIFRAPLILIFAGGIIVLVIDTLIYHSTLFSPDFFLLILGIINLALVSPIPYLLRRNFYDDSGSEIKKSKEIYDYDFIRMFSKIYDSSGVESTVGDISDYILLLTIGTIIFAYLFNCNLFLLIISVYCLLIAQYWISQLNLIPKYRFTIVLKECDPLRIHLEIKNVYILSESSTEFLAVDDHNIVMEIMKDSVQKLVYQKD